MRIFVLNCADTGNYGDDIIFEGIKIKIKNSKKSFPGDNEIIALKRINKETAKLIKKEDYLIIGGGELLSHSDILRQITSNNIKCPYEFNSVGIGGENDIKPYLDKLNPVLWSVRTKTDLEILKKLGVENAIHGIDSLFFCEVECQKKRDVIGLNLKNVNKSDNFIKGLAVELDRLVGKGINIELIALNCKNRDKIEYYGEKIWISDCNDLELMYKIRNLMDNKIKILYYQDKPLEFLSKLSCYKGIVGERLHCIMSVCYANVEFRAVSYHQKIDKFLKDYNLEGKKIEGGTDGLINAIMDLW